MVDRIAVIKTAWSDDYQGGPVIGDHAYISDYDEAHERYNFRSGPDGRYYAYTPPIGETKAPPSPDETEDWLIVAIAKRPKKSGLYVVGWFENAQFTKAYLKRPDYISDDSFPKDAHGNEFSYTLTAEQAVLIPEPLRTYKFAGSHIKRTSVSYLRGNGPAEAWKSKLAEQLLEEINNFRELLTAIPSQSPRGSKGGICADPERRSQVEKAAVEAVTNYYESKKYKVFDKQNDNVGFDLLVRSRDGSTELHVEVKGTALPTRHFLMSRNEFAYVGATPWRLAMVTNALQNPTIEIMTATEARSIFDWAPFTWHATEKKL